jgi:hypothetical protein
VTRTLPLALSLIALLGAGCGAQATGTAATPTATASQAVRFSACMRERGVDDFPDPDASGTLTVDGVLNGSGLEAESPAWKQALAACKDLQPAGFTGRERTPEEQDGSLRFARCMRDNGVEDFPDPAKGEPLVNTNRIPSSATEAGMNALNAAMNRCRDAAREAGVR